MFHGQIIAAFIAALQAIGIGHGVIIQNMPFLVEEMLLVASGAKPLPVALAEILAKFVPATPAA